MKAKRVVSAELKAGDLGEFTAVFSRFGGAPDADGDITLAGAFKDGQVVPVSAYGHRSWAGELPIGMATVRTTKTEAIADGRFFLDTTAGADTFRVVKELGALGRWSYGYDVEKASEGTWEGRPVRILEKLKLHEVSPVLIGAGRDTLTVTAKSCRCSSTLGCDCGAAADLKAAVREEYVRFVVTTAKQTMADAQDILTRRAGRPARSGRGRR